jgi:hyperosmotically inducible periplasmic protein
MRSRSRSLILASTITLALTAMAVPACSAPPSQELANARHEAQISTTFALNHYLRANDLQVSVAQGKATLTGIVDEDISKDLAKQIALGVDGITAVDNQIKVEPDHVAPHPAAERSFGDVIEDASITAAVKSKLLWSRHSSGLDTQVHTDHGKVTLQGDADSAAARDLATLLAANTRGVVAVDNQLLVNGAEPAATEGVKQAAREMGNDMSDGWITTKVKSTLMFSSNVHSAGIDVSTRSGVVTLTGNVATGTERALAIELAQNVRGVKNVNSSGLTI